MGLYDDEDDDYIWEVREVMFSELGFPYSLL